MIPDKLVYKKFSDNYNLLITETFEIDESDISDLKWGQHNIQTDKRLCLEDLYGAHIWIHDNHIKKNTTNAPFSVGDFIDNKEIFIILGWLDNPNNHNETMEKEKQYRIHLKHQVNNKTISKVFSFNAIFYGCKDFLEKNFPGYYIIGISEFTGQYDSMNNRIFENDILVFDPKEWGDDETNIHAVTWNNKEGAWCWGGGSSDDMNFRTVTGNKFENPVLWEKIIK